MNNKTQINVVKDKVQVFYDGVFIYETLLENISTCEIYGPVYMSSHLMELYYRNRDLPPAVYYEFAKVIHQHAPDTKIDWLQTLFNIELKILLDQINKLKLSFLNEKDRLDHAKCERIKANTEKIDDDMVILVGKKVNQTLYDLGLPFLGFDDQEPDQVVKIIEKDR